MKDVFRDIKTIGLKIEDDDICSSSSNKDIEYPVQCDNCGTIQSYYPISEEYPYQITTHATEIQTTAGGHIQLKCINHLNCFKFEHRYYTDLRRRTEMMSNGEGYEDLPTVEIID